MGIGAERRLTDPEQESFEGRIVREVDAEDEGVDEEPDERLDLGSVAVGDRRAHGEILVPCPALQEDEEQREQRHEGRASMRVPERADSRGELDAQGHAMAAGVVSRCRGARVVRREIERRRIRKPLLPVPELRREHVAREPPALPDSEVGVLESQLGQRAGVSLDERRMKGGDLAHEDAHRPAVRDDVVHDEQENVLFVGEAKERRAHERARGEIEGPPELVRHVGLPRGAVQRRDVHDRQRPRRRRMNDLGRLACA